MKFLLSDNFNLQNVNFFIFIQLIWIWILSVNSARYMLISIKAASEKNDAWSMFHSPQCIIVTSLVYYVPATSLETKKANAADATRLRQQNVKTMYFKTLHPRLQNLRHWQRQCLGGNMQMLQIFNELAWLVHMGIVDGDKIKFTMFFEQQ